MSARRSPCTMKMALFHEALLHMDNLTHLSIFQILRLPFSKQRFCCNHRSAALAREASFVKREAQDGMSMSVPSHARYEIRFTRNGPPPSPSPIIWGRDG